MFTDIQLPGLGVGAGGGVHPSCCPHPPYPAVHVTVHLFSSRTLFTNCWWISPLHSKVQWFWKLIHPNPKMKNKGSLQHEVYKHSFYFCVFVSASASKTIKKIICASSNLLRFYTSFFIFSTLNLQYFTIPSPVSEIWISCHTDLRGCMIFPGKLVQKWASARGNLIFWALKVH